MCKYFIKKVFLGETGKKVEDEANKTMILGNLNLNQRALERKLHFSVPTLSKGEVLQTLVLVIVSRLLGQGGHGEGTPGTFGPLSGWERGSGAILFSHRDRLLEENTQMPVETSKASKGI